MKKRVLIFNGGNTTGILLGHFINMSVDYQALSGSSYNEHSRFTFNEYYSNLPFVNDEKFVDKMNCFIEENKIDFIIPTHDTIALTLMENCDKIKATVVCSPLETATLCRYKSKTYEHLKQFDFVPKWCFAKNNSFTEFPIFVKPDDGQGGKGASVINSERELSFLQDCDNLICCELLRGEEYTVDCFTDRKGNLLFINPRKRAQTITGISSLAEDVSDATEFITIANQINSKISFRGYWFIQLKRDNDGKLKLLEICTRFAGTVAHALAKGVNLPLLALNDFRDRDVTAVPNACSVVTGKALIDRYELDVKYDAVYVDYDDTITYDGGKKINSAIMAWLYQCKNKGKKIILLSRHTATKTNSLEEDMNRLCIPKNLFDKIYDIDNNSLKSDYIDCNRSCVFVDNSFAERKEVKEKCGIPVFDVPHVECLYDWKNV